MRLLIISHTPHYKKDGQVVGWGATVREVDQLANIFDDIVHLAPLYQSEAPGNSLAYSRSNVHLLAVKPAGGHSWRAKLEIPFQIPCWLKKMRSSLNEVDAVHIRCPAGVSLVGLFALRLWAKGKPIWVKYAGDWISKDNPHTYKIQRWLLRNNFHKGIVTVNGVWPCQPSHVVSFYNPSYTCEEYNKAKRIALKKSLSIPIELIFVGRIEAEKGIWRVFEVLKGLKRISLAFNLTVIGDGPEREKLEKAIQENGFITNCSFTGWIEPDELEKYYHIAHFILLPSASEGWPKVLSEAMAFGVVPISSNVSCIPEFLAQFKTGHAIPNDRIDQYVNCILQYTEDAAMWKKESLNAIHAAKLFTYEHYLESVQTIFDHLKKNLFSNE